MLTDAQLRKLAQPIIDIFNQIELELVREVAARFDTYSTIGGSLEWQLKMLEKMGVLNRDCVKTIANYSKQTEKEINRMLKQASMANFSEEEMNQAYEDDLLRVNYDMAMNSEELAKVIKHSFIDTTKTIKLIQTKCIESADQNYMDIVNRVYVETATGTRSYSESVTRALKGFAQKGITGATYQRSDGRIINYSLEAAARRDIVTAVNQMSNKASIEYAEDIGYKYVEVSQHMGARIGDGGHNFTNHAWWQGKVYKIEGSEPGYPNLKETTGLGYIQGLGGVNCRHRTFPFIPGVSKHQDPLDYEDNKKQYQAEQGLRKLERRMRALRREYLAMKSSGNAEEAKKLRKDILSLSNEIDQYCKKNGLKRQESREVVKESV